MVGVGGSSPLAPTKRLTPLATLRHPAHELGWSAPPMAELELKFRVPDAALASLREALRAHGARSLHLQARYLDTADGRLAQQRVALRLRKEGRLWLQAIK